MEKKKEGEGREEEEGKEGEEKGKKDRKRDRRVVKKVSGSDVESDMK